VGNPVVGDGIDFSPLMFGGVVEVLTF